MRQILDGKGTALFLSLSRALADLSTEVMADLSADPSDVELSAQAESLDSGGSLGGHRSIDGADFSAEVKANPPAEAGSFGVGRGSLLTHVFNCSMLFGQAGSIRY